MKKTKRKRTPAKSRKRQKPKARARRPKTQRRKGAGAKTVASSFQQGMELAMQGFLFDAIKAFQKVAKDDKGGEFADDALFNAGLCTMRMNLFGDAIRYFSRVIRDYPEATIAAGPRSNEHGRTAAKALLGRIRCHLARGDSDAAHRDLDDLAPYDDSYVVDGAGNRRTFHDLASEALSVAAQ